MKNVRKERIDQLKIWNTILSLEVSKGHLKWKVADVARFARVSRPLVYYHFGRSKPEILAKCLEMIAEEYYGLTPERARLLREQGLRESLRQTRVMADANPALAVFYLKWRSQASPLRDQLIQFEKRYVAKLRKAFPHLTATQAELVQAFLHGLITAPFVEEKTMDEGVRFLEKNFLVTRPN